MIGTTYPDSAVVSQNLATKANPFHVESVHFVNGDTFIPFTFVYADNLATLNANAAVTQEIWRVGKHHIYFVVEQRQQLHAIAVIQLEVTSLRLIEWLGVFAVYINIEVTEVRTAKHDFLVTILTAHLLLGNLCRGCLNADCA